MIKLYSKKYIMYVSRNMCFTISRSQRKNCVIKFKQRQRDQKEEKQKKNSFHLQLTKT